LTSKLATTLACWVMGIAVVSAHAEATFPSNEDLRHVRAMADPHISPDGKRILLQVTDSTADGGRSHLWLADVASNQVRQLTWSVAADKGGEHGGRWLSDDSIVFLAKRGEGTELFSLPMAGGEARAFQLKVGAEEKVPLSIDSFEVAPGGAKIAVLARDPETASEKKQKQEHADAVWRDHDLHGERLFLFDIRSGSLRCVAVPSDVVTVAWSKRGDRLLAVTEPPNGASDLGPAARGWLIDLEELDHPMQIKEFPPSVKNGSWSDDGSHFYFLAKAEGDVPPIYMGLYAMRMADHSIRNLSDRFQGAIDATPPVIWGEDALQEVQTGTRIGYLHVHADASELLHLDFPVVRQMDCNRRQALCVWLGERSGSPAGLYVSRGIGGAVRRLSTPDLLDKSWLTAQPHVVHWASDGMSVEGLLYLPQSPSGSTVPLVVDVHGGPTSAWHDNFDPMVPFLLGQGWAVLRPNPRGSTGYGVRFVAANKNDLGGGDYRDIMMGVDTVIAQYPVDPHRLALMGYSYGGEMAGFVEGRTDRFKAIISGAPVIDQQSEYGTEDGSWEDRWYYGKPWEHVEDAWRQSPLARVSQARTPFLLLQGESDTIDPLGQSLEMYRALRQMGVQVELVQYPREDHRPLSAAMRGAPSQEPWHGFDMRQRIVSFISAAFVGSTSVN
jgi:dipeptidyl aminopeptidase/acylaminoacyl peptidase